jgi:transglutaminase-like putative cysteine protease
MVFRITHHTHFRYQSPVSESIMELRMQPRTEGWQRCFSFQLSVAPRARVHSYRDYLGNLIHFFNVPERHSELHIVAESVVETQELPAIPEALGSEAWTELDHLTADGDYWEALSPSEYAAFTPLLEELRSQLQLTRNVDPLSAMRNITRGIYENFEYVPKHTSVNSPIDHALRDRKGVCQDFAHILCALARCLRIPCRYVSGYASPDPDRPRSIALGGATHAWAEAMLPGLGWVGFDPTNGDPAGVRHVRTAIGRDYSDVPPTRGLYRGSSRGDLAVTVTVTPGHSPIHLNEDPATVFRSEAMFQLEVAAPPLASDERIHQQQQQQQ